MEETMKLPDGKTCADCCHTNRCKALFGVKPENTTCDFDPSKFQQRPIRSLKLSREQTTALLQLAAGMTIVIIATEDHIKTLPVEIKARAIAVIVEET